MESDQNNLFPADDEPRDERVSPEEDGEPTEEHLREMAAMLEEMDVEELSEAIETDIRDALSLFVFELLMTLINPTAESRKKIIYGIVDLAAKKIESDINESAEDMEPDELVAMNTTVNNAFENATSRFRGDVDSSKFDELFLERCRKAIRKNLSR